MPQRLPNECLFEALNAPKSEFFKANCSELIFKNVLPARAGSIFLQNGGKHALQIVFAFEFALAFALKFAFARSDPILDGSLCRNHTFCRRFFKIWIGDWSGKAAKKKFESHKYRKDGPMSPHLKPSMLQKVDFWRPIAQSWFSKMCFPLQRGACLCKTNAKQILKFEK